MHIHFYLHLSPSRNVIDHDIHNAHAHRIQHLQVVLQQLLGAFRRRDI